MIQVQILTSPDCSYCHAAKDLLQQRGIAYQEVDVFKEADQALKLLSQSGQRTVPQIFINEQPIGGFSELSRLLSKSEVDSTYIRSLN